ncbi:MAG: glycosyltransferase [Nitrososphaeria archaeon]
MMNGQSGNFKLLRVSVCIPAYNEEKSISYVIKSIANSKLNEYVILENIIVVSDSTDKTNEIVEGFIKFDPRVKLISNNKRLGLSKAISIAIKNTKSDILVIIDADVFLKPHSINALIVPFYNNIDVYATTGRKIPISNNPIVHAFWEVHHELCLIHPKLCSSIIAIRRGLVDEIPPFFVPDTFLMSLLEARGLKIVYIPNAVGRTLEPNDLKGFIAQRKRIYIQHLFLKKVLKYNPPAFRFSLYVMALTKAIQKNGKVFNYLACTLVEFFARLEGLLTFKREYKRSYIWEKVR